MASATRKRARRDAAAEVETALSRSLRSRHCRAGHELMQKLGKNHGRYHGETIEIDHVLREVDRAAVQHAWNSETFLTADSFELKAYHRNSPAAIHSLYLSGGIHGDEPAGPLALLRMLQENRWPDLNLWL